MERERERDRERQESDMCIMDAKTAVLSCRADCGRLRADLANSLVCLKNAGMLVWRATCSAPAQALHVSICTSLARTPVHALACI